MHIIIRAEAMMRCCSPLFGVKVIHAVLVIGAQIGIEIVMWSKVYLLAEIVTNKVLHTANHSVIVATPQRLLAVETSKAHYGCTIIEEE